MTTTTEALRLAREALTTIRSIAEWMNVNAQRVQYHPEEPPYYASEFDYRLAQVSSELFNAVDRLAALDAQPVQEPSKDAERVHAISGKTADELWLETGKLRSQLADIKAERKQKPVEEKVDWDARGILAGRLSCWHRLTAKEAEELVALFLTAPSQAAQPGYVMVPVELLQRFVFGFEHVSGIARQWEPDHSSGADRAKWARATEACHDVAAMIAAAPAQAAPLEPAP